MNEKTLSRRDVLKALGVAPMIAGGVPCGDVLADPVVDQDAGSTPQLAIVSRHLQWADMEEAAAVAAESGYRSIAWTCRPGAHILPETVERDLPQAIESARKAGLATPMLITSINDVSSPRAEAILETMRQAGITRYRAPSYRYDLSRDLQAQWEAVKPRVAALAELNQKYGVRAMFHTHSSPGSLGGGIWDLWLLVREYAPELVGINYDVGHAMVRGGTEWVQTSRFAHRHVAALSLKDFQWLKRTDTEPEEWPWTNEFVPPGQGMVNFRDMFAYFKSVQFAGPIEVYYEYLVDLGNGRSMNMLGTNRGTWELEMPRARFVSLLKRDVEFYRGLFRQIGWDVG